MLNTSTIHNKKSNMKSPTPLATLFVFIFLIATKVSGQEIFRYKSAFVYKASSNVLDTISRWENAKLKETYELSGAIYYNAKKNYIKLRRFDDRDFVELNFVLDKTVDGYKFISGKRL